MQLNSSCRGSRTAWACVRCLPRGEEENERDANRAEPWWWRWSWSCLAGRGVGALLAVRLRLRSRRRHDSCKPGGDPGEAGDRKSNLLWGR